MRALQLPAHRDHLVRRPQRSLRPKRSRHCHLLSGTKKQNANGEEPIQGGHTAIRAKIGRPNLAPKGDPDRGRRPAAPAPKEAKKL